MAITQSNAIQSFPLTPLFTITFDVQLGAAVPGVGNIIDIYSTTLGSSLLAISTEPYSTQLGVYYLGTKVISYGPQISISTSSFTTISITVGASTVTIAGSYTLVSTVTIKPVASTQNTLYASNAGLTSGGKLRNIKILGNHYCMISIPIKIIFNLFRWAQHKPFIISNNYIEAIKSSISKPIC